MLKFSQCAGSGSVLDLAGDGVQHVHAAFGVLAALVNRRAQRTALGVFQKLRALLLRFQIGNAGLQAVEGFLFVGGQVAFLGTSLVNQGAGFGHFQGAGFAQVGYFHRVTFIKGARIAGRFIDTQNLSTGTAYISNNYQ